MPRVHDNRGRDFEAPALRPRCFKPDGVALSQLLQKMEVSIPVSGDNTYARPPRRRRAGKVTGPKGQGLAAGPGEYDEALAKPRHG